MRFSFYTGYIKGKRVSNGLAKLSSFEMSDSFVCVCVCANVSFVRFVEWIQMNESSMQKNLFRIMNSLPGRCEEPKFLQTRRISTNMYESIAQYSYINSLKWIFM
jgi:hypothetical protein